MPDSKKLISALCGPRKASISFLFPHRTPFLFIWKPCKKEIGKTVSETSSRWNRVTGGDGMHTFVSFLPVSARKGFFSFFFPNQIGHGGGSILIGHYFLSTHSRRPLLLAIQSGEAMTALSCVRWGGVYMGGKNRHFLFSYPPQNQNKIE